MPIFRGSSCLQLSIRTASILTYDRDFSVVTMFYRVLHLTISGSLYEFDEIDKLARARLDEGMIEPEGLFRSMEIIPNRGLGWQDLLRSEEPGSSIPGTLRNFHISHITLSRSSMIKAVKNLQCF